MKIKRILTYIILLIILLLGLSFAAINANPVTINYYLSSASIPLSLLLVYSLGLGILLGFLVTFFPLLRLKHQNRSLKRSLIKAEQNSPPLNNHE